MFGGKTLIVNHAHPEFRTQTQILRFEILHCAQYLLCRVALPSHSHSSSPRP
jgi:hypothetical protein